MTRARALILGAVAACVAIGAVLLSSGGDDGPRAFMAADDTSALLVEWTRVGDDLSGSLMQARLVDPAPLLLGDTTLLREKPRELQQGSSAFTGTISDDSVRLRLAGNAQVTELNGQLDGDALKLIFTQENGPETINFNPSSRKDFSAAIARLRAAEPRADPETPARRANTPTRKRRRRSRASRSRTRRRLPQAARTIHVGTCPRPRRAMLSTTRPRKRPPVVAARPSSASTSANPAAHPRIASARRRSSSERL